MPTKAQAPDQGGVIIEGNFGGDVKNLNPLISSDTASQRVYGFLFPSLVGVNPDTGGWATKGMHEGDVAEGWDVSKDGLTYTFHLRKDFKWSDGTPLTAKDFLYAYQATVSGKVDAPLQGQTQERIASEEAPDDYTLVVHFKTASCTALADISFITPVPAHMFKPDFSDINDSPFNTNPSVTAGVFKFKEFRPSEQVTLVRDENYPDGKVGPDGFIYKNVPDQAVLVEQFLAGETNLIDSPPQGRRADVEANSAITPYKYPGNSWDYIALNLADPTNPVSAVDEKGAVVNADQGHHPLFGDVRVRRALQLGTNVPQMVKTAVFGYGTQMASGIIPSSWAFDKDLKPVPYDPAAAAKLLDEAGFPKGADGIRAAKGAKYAPDGTPLKFTMFTNDGNARRTAAGTIFQDNMKDLGIVVDFQPIEFNTILDKLNQQTFDAILLGWRNGYPDDPDLTQIFGTTGDVVGSGSNSGSYTNAAFDKIEKDALNIPGCDPVKRADLYKQAQKILQDDQPYIWLYVQDGMYAARKNVEGFDPRPSNLFWNVDKWHIGPPVASK